MRVLGVDPGSIVTGWGVVEGAASSPRLVGCGAIRLPTRVDTASRLDALYRELSVVAERWDPALAAVENPFHGVSSKSALRLAQARGVILAALARGGVAVAEYAPAAVKLSVTGNGRADKLQVQAMVTRLLGSAGSGWPHDVYDALAVALCHLSQTRFTAAVERARRC